MSLSRVFDVGCGVCVCPVCVHACLRGRSYATVGGGWDNIVSGMYATVGGGWDNIVSGM